MNSCKEATAGATSTGDISVRPFQDKDAAAWKAFLDASNNGTLFHDLDFLSYHAAGRFQVSNLLFFRGGELVALLPASLLAGADGRLTLRSPYGASVGGFVLPRKVSLRTLRGIVAALEAHARSLDAARVELVLGPTAYADECHDLAGFCLAAGGFRLTQRWLTPMVPLGDDPAQVLQSLPSKRRQSYIRSALKNGLEVQEAGVESLPEFYQVLVENRARHAARPTHSLDELGRIFRRVPDRARLFVCRHQQEVVAGTVVFELNRRVAYSFCPAHAERCAHLRPAAVLLFGVLQHYTGRGFRYLDLGPTGTSAIAAGQLSLNEGNARFKEEMGGLGFIRDCWCWNAA